MEKAQLHSLSIDIVVFFLSTLNFYNNNNNPLIV